MTDQPLEWLLEQPAGLSLLAAYAQREAEVPRKPRTAEAAPAPVPDPPVTVAEGDDEEDDSATWIPRLTR